MAPSEVTPSEKISSRTTTTTTTQEVLRSPRSGGLWTDRTTMEKIIRSPRTHELQMRSPRAVVAPTTYSSNNVAIRGTCDNNNNNDRAFSAVHAAASCRERTPERRVRRSVNVSRSPPPEDAAPRTKRSSKVNLSLDPLAWAVAPPPLPWSPTADLEHYHRTQSGHSPRGPGSHSKGRTAAATMSMADREDDIAKCMIAGMKPESSTTSSPPSTMIPGITGERGYGLSVGIISRKLRKARPPPSSTLKVRATPKDIVSCRQSCWWLGQGLTPEGGDTIERCLKPERHEMSPTRKQIYTVPPPVDKEQILSPRRNAKCGEKKGTAAFEEEVYDDSSSRSPPRRMMLRSREQPLLEGPDADHFQRQDLVPQDKEAVQKWTRQLRTTWIDTDSSVRSSSRGAPKATTTTTPRGEEEKETPTTDEHAEEASRLTEEADRAAGWMQLQTTLAHLQTTLKSMYVENMEKKKPKKLKTMYGSIYEKEDRQEIDTLVQSILAQPPSSSGEEGAGGSIPGEEAANPAEGGGAKRHPEDDAYAAYVAYRAAAVGRDDFASPPSGGATEESSSHLHISTSEQQFSPVPALADSPSKFSTFSRSSTRASTLCSNESSAEAALAAMMHPESLASMKKAMMQERGSLLTTRRAEVKARKLAEARAREEENERARREAEEQARREMAARILTKSTPTLRRLSRDQPSRNFLTCSATYFPDGDQDAEDQDVVDADDAAAPVVEMDLGLPISPRQQQKSSVAAVNFLVPTAPTPLANNPGVAAALRRRSSLGSSDKEDLKEAAKGTKNAKKNLENAKKNLENAKKNLAFAKAMMTLREAEQHAPVPKLPDFAGGPRERRARQIEAALLDEETTKNGCGVVARCSQLRPSPEHPEAALLRRCWASKNGYYEAQKMAGNNTAATRSLTKTASTVASTPTTLRRLSRDQPGRNFLTCSSTYLFPDDAPGGYDQVADKDDAAPAVGSHDGQLKKGQQNEAEGSRAEEDAIMGA